MAQIAYGGQGLHGALSPLTAAAIVLIGLIFALLGIKLWGFKRRLNFQRREATATVTAQTPLSPGRYARALQVNGADNSLDGVFRQRNAEEIEGPQLASAAATSLAGSVPNLRAGTLSPLERLNEGGHNEMADVTYRQQPQVPNRKRRDVRCASFEYYVSPPTRKPPMPPAATAAVAETPTELDIPNFDHFAQKYELFAAKTMAEDANGQQRANKVSGGYVKYEPVDDDLVDLEQPSLAIQEPLTPDDEQSGAAVSVAAIVHNALNGQEEEERNSDNCNSNLELQSTESAFVVEIVAATPDVVTELIEPLPSNLFDDLETSCVLDTSNVSNSHNDADFLRIRSNYVMNEADILDFDQLQLPPATSPPGFGKSIDEDWENFEDLAGVDVPEPNWTQYPRTDDVEQVPSVANTLDEATLRLDNVVQLENLFQELELMQPVEETLQLEPRPDSNTPPPYTAPLPQLPDYESLMLLENSETNQSLPKYADVVSNDNTASTKYISTIDDLFAELQSNEAEPAASTSNANDFELLCQELEIVATPRVPPQPAPRISKMGTLNVRGNAAPLPYYDPEELSSSSDSEAYVGPAAPVPPQATKRNARTLKVRFDVENLQYYQSAELRTSSESDSDDYALEPPRPMMRLTKLGSNNSLTEPNDGPMLFGAQVSQTGNGEDGELTTDSWRAVSQHRCMTEELQRVHKTETEGSSGLGAVPKQQHQSIRLERSAQSDTEA